jgi:hypothetical protein
VFTFRPAWLAQSAVVQLSALGARARELVRVAVDLNRAATEVTLVLDPDQVDRRELSDASVCLILTCEWMPLQ